MTTPTSISIDDVNVDVMAIPPTAMTYSCAIPEWLQQCLNSEQGAASAVDALPETLLVQSEVVGVDS